MKYFIFLFSLTSLASTCPSLKGTLSNCRLANDANFMVKMIWNRFNIEPLVISEVQDSKGNILSYSNQTDTFELNKTLKVNTDIGELVLAPIRCNAGFVQTKTTSIIEPLKFEVEAEISVSANTNSYQFYIRNSYSNFQVLCQRKI